MNKFDKSIKIIVNLMTTSRIVFSFILLSIFNDINKVAFIFLLTSIFFTDFLDGFLARKFKVQTLYGSIMDTVADKVLSIVLLIPLLDKLFIYLLIMIGELSIAILNIIGKIMKKHTYSNNIGKFKMWVLSIIIILGYIYYYGYINNIIVIIGSIFTFCLQLYVIWLYYVYFKEQNINKNIKKYKINNYKDLLYVLFNTKYFLDYIQIKD